MGAVAAGAASTGVAAAAVEGGASGDEAAAGAVLRVGADVAEVLCIWGAERSPRPSTT